jgi:sugar phosphate isomerase/epimerase
VEAWSARQVEEVRARFAVAGLEVAQLLPPAYPSLVDPDAGQRRAGLETLARCGEIAARAGADNLYVRPGSLNPRGPWLPHPGNHRPEVRERLRESLAAAARRAEAQGIVLAVEGHILSPLDTPETTGDLLESIGSPALRFNLDLVNYVGSVDAAYDSTDLEERLFRRLGGVMQAAHLKDVVVEERLVVHIGETVPGRGLLDLGRLLARFAAARPGGWVILEHLAEADLPEAVAATRRAAEAVGCSL